MHQLVVFWFGLVSRWGYGGIVALMAMESSIFPVPSEVVIPPAAYWASQGQFSFWGVVLAGTLGSYLGSAITYWVSFRFGRLLVVKWGRYFMITEEKIVRAERFVHRYEAGGIFFARLLPVVRHLISIPAGLVGMNFTVFSGMTLVGSFLWCWILAWFGVKVSARHPEVMNDPAAMVHAIKAESLPLVAGILILCVLYFVAMRLTSRKSGDLPPAA